MYLSAQTSPEWTSGNAKKWMKSAVWSNGWTVSPHKSVNAVEFACQYHKNKDVWDAAFRFLAEHDLEALSIGNHVILEGKCWATVSEYIPKEVEKGCCFLYLFPDKTLLCRCRQFLLVFPFGHSPAFCSGKGGTC